MKLRDMILLVTLIVGSMGGGVMWISSNLAFAGDIEKIEVQHKEDIQQIGQLVYRDMNNREISEVETDIMIIEGAYPDMSKAPMSVQKTYEEKKERLARLKKIRLKLEEQLLED